MRGGIDPGDHCFLSRDVGGVDVWKDFIRIDLIREWDSILPGYRWLHEPKFISDQSMG